MAQGDLLGTLSANTSDITNPFPATGSVAVSVGDLVYVVIGEASNLTVTAVTDNLGNSYSAITAGRDSGGCTGRAFYSRVSAAGTITSVSATCSASTDNGVIIAAVFQGPYASSPLDAAPADVEDTTGSFSCPATGVLAQANETVACYMVWDTNDTQTATAPNIKALQVTAGTGLGAAVGYQTVSSTASVTPVWTGNIDLDDVLGTASFKFAAVSAKNWGYQLL